MDKGNGEKVRVRGMKQQKLKLVTEIGRDAQRSGIATLILKHPEELCKSRMLDAIQGHCRKK